MESTKAMPYPRSEPIDERAMDKDRYEGHHTICQNLRDIYHMMDAIKADPSKVVEIADEVRLRCRVGMTMTKKMNNKLKWYKKWYVTTLNEDPTPMLRKIDKGKIEVND